MDMGNALASSDLTGLMLAVEEALRREDGLLKNNRVANAAVHVQGAQGEVVACRTGGHIRSTPPIRAGVQAAC